VLMCFGANGAVSTRDFNLHEINLPTSRVVNQACYVCLLESSG
jgi:hypothetical protein